MAAVKITQEDIAFGARMRVLRHATGLTLEQVAFQMDLTYQQIYKYEMGKNRLAASRLPALAGALGVSLGDFFERQSNVSIIGGAK